MYNPWLQTAEVRDPRRDPGGCMERTTGEAWMANQILLKLNPSALRRRILDMPTERAIALGRLALVLTCVVAVWVSPPPQHDVRMSLWLVLGFYTIFAGALVFGLRLGSRSTGALIEQGVDILVTGFLILSTQGSASAFFSLFMFNLIVSLLRWNWRGTLATAAITASSLMLLPARFQVTEEGLVLLDADLSRVIALGGSLVICGMMLAYLGAHRERSRRRFEQLAAWPIPAQREVSLAPAEALGHVAMMLQAPRVLLIWEEAEEPVRQVCLWDGGRIEHSQVSPDVYGPLAQPSEPGVVFCTEENQSGLDADLRERYSIGRVLTASFQRPRCSGLLLVLDFWTWSVEDAALTELITERIALDLEEQIVRRQVEAALLSQERMRLGRDLHDGLLQDLAAANIHLKLIADRVPTDLKNQIDTVRSILVGETDRVRTFVENNRRADSPSLAPIQSRLRERADILATQWGCTVDVHVDPPETKLPVLIIEQLEHIVGEATSNAVRHGRASQVLVVFIAEGATFALRITDNGCGFDGRRGSASAELGSTQPVAPYSLASRVKEMGGRLQVADTPAGAAIEINLPRRLALEAILWTTV